MTDDELLALINEESDRIEFKRQLKNVKEEVAQAICAFANDLPRHGKSGIVVIGKENGGDCAHLQIDDQLLRDLTSLARFDGNILPLPSVSVQKRTLEGCELAIVIVEPARDTPVRYKGQIYVRIGPTTAIATPEDERLLTEKRRSANQPFDISPVFGSTIGDLDLLEFEETYVPASVSRGVIEENQRTTAQKLSSLRLIDPETSVPTVTGILTVGREPDNFIPSAYIQLLRIDGTGLADPILDEKRIAGPLLQQLSDLDDLIQINISTRIRLAGAIEGREPDYPVDAIRQMTRNAVMHRSYDGTNAPIRIYWFTDRIEIWSPGGPYGQVTRENFGRPGITDYRNPHIAEVMKNLGYVQRFGVGFELTRSLLAKNGNPELEVVVEPTAILITLRKGSL